MIKLRNKRTGEIGYLHSDSNNQVQVSRNTGYNYKHYNTLTELVEEWEDAPEEPKAGYIIDPMEEDCVSADDSGYEESDIGRAKELGIWFETEEEAEQAVEKLKAWKRLKDKGFRFVEPQIHGMTEDGEGDGAVYFELDKQLDKLDLDLLFSEVKNEQDKAGQYVEEI